MIRSEELQSADRPCGKAEDIEQKKLPASLNETGSVMLL
jgi:hypothetical protein